MQYEERLVFTMTVLRTHHEDILKISEMMRYHRKYLDALDCTAFSCHEEETGQSCGARCIFFYFSNTGRLPIVTCHENNFLGERELCGILYEYICI